MRSVGIVVWVPNRSVTPYRTETASDALDGCDSVSRSPTRATLHTGRPPRRRCAERVCGTGSVRSSRSGRTSRRPPSSCRAARPTPASSRNHSHSRLPCARPADSGRFRRTRIHRLTQGGLILPWAGSRPGAAGLRDYLLSGEGRQLLASHGFGLAGEVGALDWVAVGLTLKLAALTTLILAVVGLPLAYWLATTPHVHGDQSWMPPWPCLCCCHPRCLASTSWCRQDLTRLSDGLYNFAFGGTIPFSFAGVSWLASVLYNLPFAVRPFASGFAAVDRRAD